MKKIVFIIVIVIVVGWFTIPYWKYVRGIWPSLLKPDEDIAEYLDQDTSPLALPEGFTLSLFADNIPSARVIIFDEFGDLWVSQTKEGKITRLDVRDGVVVSREVVFDGLNNPHGLAFDPRNPSILYIAEEDKVSQINLTSRERGLQSILELPSGDGHFTRTIKFGPDNRLYISIGSSCNVCREGNEKRASILSYGRGASDLTTFATGLRNAVFFSWDPLTEKMWTTEMGRDLLGDDLPPDEINVVEEGGFYGWPVCYGKNIHDIDFDKNTYIRNPCLEPFEKPSYVDIPAHSAPLGIGFIPRSTHFPRDYWYDAIVAYHGSWNRSTPTGYKLVRINRGEKGEIIGVEDFITGWLTSKNKVIGRPVDVLVRDKGVLFVSDDYAGVIYKIEYKKP